MNVSFIVVVCEWGGVKEDKAVGSQDQMGRAQVIQVLSLDLILGDTENTEVLSTQM